MRHKHHDVIVAWANGAVIEAFDNDGQAWLTLCAPFFWNEDHKYRVKPEPPKVYPVTLMTPDSMRNYYNADLGGSMAESLTRVANAAIRHAVDAGQIITALDHNNALAALDVSLTADRDARDMAIARAMDGVYCTLVPTKQRNSDGYLAAIIAKVAP